MMTEKAPASPSQPAQPHNAQSGEKHDAAPQGNQSSLQNEYRGEASRDGIPANGTAPTAARGPDDVGA
ncbi:hypothetical protein [Paracoccus contaminans]|uniref:Uncharacterized protein n=1 Tax=Paracoccus contaminans TaxID=1945662 RepID=A0A1W6CUE0_9RHOB|nr:hypothetical protein [Paracoccus contaminans]ARJ68455.1 hypothetical protein B0A89_01115 [Paracoccus contaminans]